MKVTEEETGKRLDVYLAKHFKDESRSVWKKRIDRGDVYINGMVATKANKILNENDAIEISEFKKEPSPFTVDVVYEDEDVLVCNKPSGLLVHSKGGLNEETTLVDIFAKQLSFEAGNRPGVVHRLDRDTSGVIILAKNPETKLYLQKQFANRSVLKTYTAVVSGQMAKKTGTIKKPLKRGTKHPGTWEVSPEGKLAETAFKVLETNETNTLVELYPKTGRTHQLRVHLQSIGHPIVNDRLYGQGRPQGRLLLHATSLEISIGHNSRKTFKAKTPPELAI